MAHLSRIQYQVSSLIKLLVAVQVFVKMGLDFWWLSLILVYVFMILRVFKKLGLLMWCIHLLLHCLHVGLIFRLFRNPCRRRTKMLLCGMLGQGMLFISCFRRIWPRLHGIFECYHDVKCMCVIFTCYVFILSRNSLT